MVRGVEDIVYPDPRKLLNKRPELASLPRHESKFCLVICTRTNWGHVTTHTTNGGKRSLIMRVAVFYKSPDNSNSTWNFKLHDKADLCFQNTINHNYIYIYIYIERDRL